MDKATIMYIYSAIFIYRIRIRKPDSHWKQDFAGHPTALGKYPFTVTKLQGHSTTECSQIHQKCLTWFLYALEACLVNVEFPKNYLSVRMSWGNFSVAKVLGG